MRLKKFIGDRAFYKMVLTLAVPIIVQNFITNLVNMLDNVMVGTLGTEQVSAVAIVNQLLFIFNLGIFGAVSGAGIFTSQYFGKKDNDGIRYTIRFKFIVCAFLMALAFCALTFGAKFFISLYLHDGSYDCDVALALKFAIKYLRIMLVGLVPYVIAQVYSSTLKETGSTFLPMVAGLCAVAVNTLLNYLLIFGIGIFPAMGVEGAALGTVISRFVECTVVLLYVHKTKRKSPYFKGALISLWIPLGAAKEFLKKGIPLLINELIWAIGMSLLAMCYSSYGLAAVAGYSISSSVVNLMNITFRSLGIAVGIVAGRDLGANDFDGAVDNVRKLNFFALCVSVVIGLVTFFMADFVPYIYNVSYEAENFSVYFIKASSVFMPFLCYENSSYFTLRAGGRVFITSLFDGYFVLFVAVSTAFIFRSFATVAVTYVAVQATDVLKAAIGFILLKSKIWVRNLVEEDIHG